VAEQPPRPNADRRSPRYLPRSKNAVQRYGNFVPIWQVAVRHADEQLCTAESNQPSHLAIQIQQERGRARKCQRPAVRAISKVEFGPERRGTLLRRCRPPADRKRPQAIWTGLSKWRTDPCQGLRVLITCRCVRGTNFTSDADASIPYVRHRTDAILHSHYVRTVQLRATAPMVSPNLIRSNDCAVRPSIL
jgi:hypothetical protein